MSKLYSLSEDLLFKALDARRSGLSKTEAQRRLSAFGLNEIEKRRRKNYILEYIKQYTKFFAVLLEIAAVLSFFASIYSSGEGYDILGYAILGAVVINATFAFWQEYKADKTVEALLKLIPNLVNVRRNNSIEKLNSKFLVPGDVLLIEEGDRIAADAIIIEANALQVNMANLTGESTPVKRFSEPDETDDILDAENVVFAGTTAVSGNGVGVVFVTGKDTEFGKIATMTRVVTKRKTPMQIEIVRITRILTVAAVLVGGIFFVLGYLSGRGPLIAAIFALSLIVANVPEGMLPTITLSLSIASQNMAKRNALIKNLDSVQTLGSATVIITDKTGTITRNEMTAKEIVLSSGEEISVSGEGYSIEGDFSFREETAGSKKRLEFFLNAGRLNCRAGIKDDTIYGDPTELAIVVAALKNCPTVKGYEKLEEIPFSSKRQMMSTIYRKNGETFTFSKGSLEKMITKSTRYIDDKSDILPISQEVRDMLVRKAEDLEKKAYRVLAIAFREGAEEEDLVMLGLIALMDLPRAEVHDAIERCHRAGINVLICTGDNPFTALAIARMIGLEVSRAYTGPEIAKLSDEEIREILTNDDILFARMLSHQKLRITTILQEMGEVVAMTGDGVNDAPALKKADIGVSMGIRGTEVAKEAADMILLDDNFASIVAAIEEGRTVYFNIKKFVTYILSSNIPEIVPYILQFFLRIPLPLSVIQILSIDLGSDMLPGLALGSERPEKDIMDRPPIGRDERILDKEVFKRGYFFLGAIEGAAAMVAFLGFLFLMGWQYGDLSITNTELHRQAMTMTLLGAVTCQLFNVWTLRSWEFSIFQIGLFKNKLLIVAIIIEVIWIYTLLNVNIVQVFFNTAYIPPEDLLILLPFPILLFVSHEVYKSRYRKRNAQHERNITPD